MPGQYIDPRAVVDAGAQIGDGTKVWHGAHVMGGAVIGRDCVLGQGCFVAASVRIGDGCRIQNHVSLYDGVTLAQDVFLGPSCVFTNVRYPRAQVSRKAEFEETRVERGATIGANATIVCGVTIGAHAMIGAGAVVTRSVAPHALMVGVPARQVGWVCRCGEPLGFAASDDQVDLGIGCARCADQYRLTDGRVRREA
jgi:UDP-2-acetamido-3-amino-2,3-dideoxy-glucuronate N-acetyltransferase